MNIKTSILMLINLAILVLIGVGITRLLGKLTVRLGVKLNICMIGCYLALLVMLSVVCFFLPSNHLQTLTSSHTAYGTDLLQTILDNNFGDIEGCLRAEYAFSPQSNSVSIQLEDNIPQNVYVGTKGVDAPDNGDGNIDVYSYSYATAEMDKIPRFDVPIEPLLVSFNQDNLTVKNPENKAVRYYCFDDQILSAGQFFNTTLSSSGGSSCCQIVAILLPPGVTCTNADVQSFSQLNELS